TNFVVGGAQDYLILLVKNLDRSKFEPIIMGRMEGEWVSTIKGLPSVTCVDIPSLRREISPLRDVQATFQIWKACRKYKVDILHTHSSKPGIIGRLGACLAGVKGTVHTIHGFSFHEFMPSWKRKFFIFLERLMSKFTSVLILYSKENFKTAKELKISASRSVEMFYYGIDYTPFEDHVDVQMIRKQFGFNDDHYIIGFTGRFMEQKGLNILIEAFCGIHKKFPHTRLLLVGDGALRPELEKQIQSVNLQHAVTITGFRSDIPKLLRSMNLFVMTSLWEGLSRSLAEAMYAELPIIATDVGGTSDAIRHSETGWLIKPMDVNAVTGAIEDALLNPSKAKLYAKNASVWARNQFNLTTMSKNMEQVYFNLYE
ncbi:MAG: glycosyltransferase family 4 protein, partial [Bacteroidota bacterium]